MNDVPEIAGFEPLYEGTPGEVGWKFRISLKKLGRNLKKLARSKALQGALRVAQGALKNPLLAAAIPAPYRMGIQAGIATMTIKERAAAGDPKARALVSQATSGQPTARAVVSDTDTAPSARFCPCCGQPLESTP